MILKSAREKALERAAAMDTVHTEAAAKQEVHPQVAAELAEATAEHPLINGLPEGETASLEWIDDKPYAVVVWRHHTVKERLPLDIASRPEAYLTAVAKRLRVELIKLVRPKQLKQTKVAKVNRQREKKAMGKILEKRFEKLIEVARSAAHPEQLVSPAAYYRAVGLGEAVSLLLGRPVTPPLEPNWPELRAQDAGLALPPDDHKTHCELHLANQPKLPDQRKRKSPGKKGAK